MSFKNLLSTLLLLFPIILFAQKAQVKGVVVDRETKSPISGASVMLLTKSGAAIIKNQQTTENGGFEISSVEPAVYMLKVTYVGYDDLIKENVTLVANQQLDLKMLEMSEESQLIKEVVIQGSTPDMRIGIDKKIFDVSQSMVSVGGSASDLLANVPTLQVDQDGALSLRGSSNVRVLIDGKESAMAGSDIGAFLQSLPADVIDKVEIITNPSAKYDAEGQSGIVNIILKKNARVGLNGTVTASAGSFENAMAGITVNYRDSKFNYFGNYNFNRRVNKGDGFNDNVQYVDGAITPSSIRTLANNESNRLGNNHTIRLGTDYYLSDKTTLSLAGNLSIRANDRSQILNYQYWNLPQNGDSGNRNSQQYEDDLGIDAQFDFRQLLKKDGEEITVNLSFGRDTEDGKNDFLEYFSGSRLDVIRNNVTTEKGRNWNAQLDYVLPLGENHKFETGYRSIIRNSEDTQFSSVSRDGSSTLLPDYFLSNDFDLKSSVHAVYANYQRMLSSKLGAQLGLRAEQADLISKYYNLDPNSSLNDRVTEGKLDYFRLYPSAFLSYEVGSKGDKIQLGYSRRVQRPRGWQVNPFISASDESNLRQGNPNLMPEDIHSAELSFAKFYSTWNFVTSAFYRRTNDMISPLQYDPSVANLPIEFQNASYSIWQNVGSSNDFGFELISKVNITRNWDFTANANIFNNRIEPISGMNLNRVNAVNWDGNLTTNVKLIPTLSLQVRGDYRSKRERPQGNMKEMWGVDAAIKKDLMRNRASVMFNARDLFNSRLFEWESFLDQRYVGMSNRWNRRMFTLTFTYKFGVQDLFKKDDKREGGSMDDMGGGEF